MKFTDIAKVLEVLREGNSIENPAGAKWFSVACEALAVVLVFGSVYAVQRGLLDQSFSVPQALDFAQVVIGALFGLLGLSRAAAVAADPARGLPAKRVLRSSSVSPSASRTVPKRAASPATSAAGDAALGHFSGE